MSLGNIFSNNLVGATKQSRFANTQNQPFLITLAMPHFTHIYSGRFGPAYLEFSTKPTLNAQSLSS